MSARTRSITMLVLLAVAGVADGASKSQKRSEEVAYRWVDEKGVVHYGDHVPPEYADQERTILNNQGVEVRTLEAQKSPEQIAADRQREQDRMRQRQRDSFLLTTYTSVKDIEALRDVRLDQLKGQRTAAELYIQTLQERLNALQARALTFKPYNAQPNARRMPDDLAEDLVRTLNEMRTQRNTLAAKAEEESAVRQQFQADIDRYRELRTTG